MSSYLVGFLEKQVEYNRSDCINIILHHLYVNVLPNTRNYFDELIEVAKVCKPMNALAWYYQPFVEQLKKQIMAERGEDGGPLLIRKFE